MLYPAHAAAALIKKAEDILADEARRQTIAEAGLVAVDARHRASHRALAFTSRLDELTNSGRAEKLIAGRKKNRPGNNRLHPLSLHHAESIENEALRLHFLEANRTARSEIRHGGPAICLDAFFRIRHFSKP